MDTQKTLAITKSSAQRTGKRRSAVGLEVAFASIDDHTDVSKWSGTVFFMARSLEQQGVRMHYLDQLQRRRLLISKAFKKMYSLAVPGSYFPMERSVPMGRHFAEEIARRVKDTRAHVVFSPGSIPLALLEQDRPKAFYTDATFAGILDQYPELRNYPKEHIEEGHYLEREAIRTTDLIIYSSTWAADSAIKHYGADPARIRVIPFGSNMLLEPDEVLVERAISARSPEECVLLFLGVNWERKGGKLAMQVAASLNAAGLPTKLKICGCEPDQASLPPFAEVVPFISKRTAKGQRTLQRLIASSHFLILPSIADCTPIVVNECSSLGVPCLTSDVGGMTEVVRDGRNGFTFPLAQGAAPYVRTVTDVMGDPMRYLELCQRTRREYLERLNWKATGGALKRELATLAGLK